MNYVDEDISPLYPFGWGLSYSRFAYSDAAIGKKELSTDDTLEASVTITNTVPEPGRRSRSSIFATRWRAAAGLCGS